MIDFEQDQAEAITQTNDVKALSDQVVKLRSLEDNLAAKEKELKDLKKDIDLLSGEVIPTMMTEMNVSTLKLADGSAVEVKPVYGASIPADKKEEAFTWLRSNGLGDLIKNEVTVAFGRNEDNKAAEYATLAQGRGYEPIQKLKVEPMTLKALVRERLESGKEMPSDLFNVFAGNRTKLTRK
jgi:hypothetical protein|tara:strand:+ start:1103 stop:1648 length:546 start_codon:yes stop_codon:yes gene_type:complete